MHTCERSKKNKKNNNIWISTPAKIRLQSGIGGLHNLGSEQKKTKKQDVNKCVIKEFTIMFQYGYATNDQISMGCKREREKKEIHK